jgi:uncharacterized protein YfaP (DUF2135 family)
MTKKSVWMLLAAAGPCLAQVSLDAPRNGWRHTAGDVAGFQQEVNYPASSVNLGRQPSSAQIRGRIDSAAKSPEAGKSGRRDKDGQATLIVNGVAMPVAVRPDGTFVRPYAFGRGANSVEVRTAEGQTRRVAFYDSYPGRTQARLRVVLSWDSNNTDLDLHVVSPDGQHVFYGTREVPNGGALDIDVTTGYGPEIYASPSPPDGVYHVWVNYYGGESGEGGEQALTTANVTVITQENTPAEKLQSFRVPMRRAGELTLVKSFSYP